SPLHATRGAGRTEPPALAGEGDQHLVTARAAAHAGKAVGEDAAGEVSLALHDDEAGQTRAVASLLHLGKKRLQMGADRLVQHRPLGFAASIPWAGRGARRYRLCL